MSDEERDKRLERFHYEPDHNAYQHVEDIRSLLADYRAAVEEKKQRIAKEEHERAKKAEAENEALRADRDRLCERQNRLLAQCDFHAANVLSQSARSTVVAILNGDEPNGRWWPRALASGEGAND